MQIPKKKLAIIIASVVIIAGAGTGIGIGVDMADRVSVTFVQTLSGGAAAGIMIEANGLRAYVDLYLPTHNYRDLKADAIFITHPDLDHYSVWAINDVSKETTQYVGPSSCVQFINLYNGTGVIPGDTGEVAGFHYEAIPAYNGGHPIEEQWCGYVITVNGVSIFHSGDTNNLTEYEDLAGRIDVACLPIEYSCGNMGPIGAVWATSVIQPRYVIPIHYGTSDTSEFVLNCQSMNPTTIIHNSYNPLILNSLF